MAEDLKKLPTSPIVGHVLARSGGHSIATFQEQLESTHGFKRSIMVPLEVPEEFMRYLRSAQARSRGPTDDVSSGVDFAMFTVGRQILGPKDKGDGAASDGDADMDAGDDDDVASEQVNVQKLSPDQMNAAELKQMFGDSAEDISALVFQHSSRLGSIATCKQIDP